MPKALALALLLLLPACRRPQTTIVLSTSLGDISIRLNGSATAKHFAGLAEGSKQWRDAKTGQVRYDPYYMNVPFHRVIPGFVIQTGENGPIGYFIADEFAGSKFDRAGLVGFSNEGAGTGATGFFITLAPASMLDGRHAIVGEVTSGLDVAKKIADVPRDASERGGDRPLKPVLLKSARVQRR
jgi:peptidyl-prolyl cis-trans isomerase A (cyclophilin A)